MSAALWHGTSALRLRRIVAAGVLTPPTIGMAAVSLTEDRSVAVYFARNSALASDDAPSMPIVLRIDRDKVEALGLTLEPYEDHTFGEGKHSWERETICESEIPMSCITAIELADEDEISFSYVNWRGETAERQAKGPFTIRFGTSEWHSEPQHLVSGLDLERGLMREYALADMTPRTKT